MEMDLMNMRGCYVTTNVKVYFRKRMAWENSFLGGRERSDLNCDINHYNHIP